MSPASAPASHAPTMDAHDRETTVDEDAVAAGVASAVAQGFPAMVNDPAVLRAIEEAVR
jgi:hypothetical protein